MPMGDKIRPALVRLSRLVPNGEYMHRFAWEQLIHAASDRIELLEARLRREEEDLDGHF